MSEWRWKFFEPEEVLSPDGLRAFRLGMLLLVDDRVLDALTAVREETGCPVTINFGNNLLRGYRSVEEHKTIPQEMRAKYSQHCFGRAADVTIFRLSFAETLEVLKKHFPFCKPYPAQNFVHCDFGFRLS